MVNFLEALYVVTAVLFVTAVVACVRGRGRTADARARRRLARAPSSLDYRSQPAAAFQEALHYGPQKGALVIAGGGSMDDTGIVEKFIQLAGGPSAKFVIVPTAGGNRNQEGAVRAYKSDDVVASWLKRGLKNVKMLHTHDPKVADTDERSRACCGTPTACGSTAAANGTSWIPMRAR